MSSYTPLVVAAIAGVVAVFGYLINSRIGRLRERERYFVDALLAVEKYKQLPCWRHRLTERDDLARRIGEVHENLAYHRRLLQLNSPQVYLAYTALVNTIRSRNRLAENVDEVFGGGTNIELDKKYSSRSKPDRDECLRLMSGDLRLFPYPKRVYRRPDDSASPTTAEELTQLSS